MSRYFDPDVCTQMAREIAESKRQEAEQQTSDGLFWWIVCAFWFLTALIALGMSGGYK